MLWRIVTGLAALTFVVGGLDILSSECEAVDFGGSARSSTYACVPAGSGDASAGTAGGGMLLLGVLGFSWATWPLWPKRLRHRSSVPPAICAYDRQVPRVTGPTSPIDDYRPQEGSLVAAESHDPFTAARSIGRSYKEIRSGTKSHPRRREIDLALRVFDFKLKPAGPLDLWFVADCESPLVIVFQGSTYLCSPAAVEVVDHGGSRLQVQVDDRGQVSALELADRWLTDPQPQTSVLVFQMRINQAYDHSHSVLDHVTALDRVNLDEPTPTRDQPREQALGVGDSAEALTQTDPTSTMKCTEHVDSPSDLPVTSALEELEQLRKRKLITHDEYRQKREEILARL